MKTKVKKIIIVGGGSAGWMSAAMLCKRFPHLDIAVIESPAVPIIGVGESTLGTINQYLNLLGLEDKDWMEYCRATYKLAIKFSHFSEKGEIFYYPFGVKDQQNCQAGLMDWYVKKVLYPDTSNNDFYESYYSVMPFIYNTKIYDNSDGQLPGFNFQNDVAYHMDAALFGEFLKEKICIPNGVVYINQHIDKIETTKDDFIDYLVLDNGDQINADLYVDCTGFKSLLLEETLKVPFVSFSDVLPNNKAWTCHIPYVDKEKEMENVTDCKAIENGWVWNIPLYNRIGSGYVYSNKFISDEEALEEFKNHLDGPDMTIPDSQRSKNLKFKLIDIKNGIHDQCWKNNVVAVGLSYGFIEPLESTGLLSVQEIILKLCETLSYKTINRIHIDNFNYLIEGIMQGFKNFVNYHYSLSARRDTDYWKYVTEQIVMDPTMNNRQLKELPGQVKEMATRLLQTHYVPGDPQMGGMPDILVGMNTLPTNTITLDIVDQIVTARNNGARPEFLNSQTQEYWHQKKDYIEKIAEKSLSHYQYLKEKIYDNKDIEFDNSGAHSKLFGSDENN
jgi:flavin-dependent dehydrogenase